MLALALGAPGALAQAAADAQVREILAEQGDPARGRTAFGDCAGCHRKDASGRVNGSVPRLSGQHASVIVKQIVDIRSGRRLNPAMKEVLDEQPLDPRAIADVAAYLQSLPPAGARGKGPGGNLARGKALFEKDCVACHGAEGDGAADTFVPMVAAQHYAYLLRELEMIRSGTRGNSNPAMAAVLQRYSADDLQAVADFLAQLPPPTRRR